MFGSAGGMADIIAGRTGLSLKRRCASWDIGRAAHFGWNIGGITRLDAIWAAFNLVTKDCDASYCYI
jgi:hypothetical protein